jgi:hypothetical protein
MPAHQKVVQGKHKKGEIRFLVMEDLMIEGKEKMTLRMQLIMPPVLRWITWLIPSR